MVINQHVDVKFSIGNYKDIVLYNVRNEAIKERIRREK